MIITTENYFSPEAETEYCSSTQYREICGTIGRTPCEARVIAKMTGKWQEEPTTAMLVGSYVDAHFSGTLDVWKAQHPEIYKAEKKDKKGKKSTTGKSLRSDYVDANAMIARIERDPYFMRTMAGGKQVIMTAEMYGLKWKAKIDSYHPGKAIVDLKTTQSIYKPYNVRDYGYVSFIEYWGYDIQLAIYQEIDYLNTGVRLPVFIGAVSKEEAPDIDVFFIDQLHIDEILKNVELSTGRITALKSGKTEPVRCENCDYCRSTKVLKSCKHYTEIIPKI